MRGFGGKKKIGEHETVALKDLPGSNGDGTGKTRRVVNQCVKLAVLAAGIDIRWKAFEERLVEIASGKGCVELSRIDARDFRPDPCCDHVARQ